MTKEPKETIGDEMIARAQEIASVAETIRGEAEAKLTKIAKPSVPHLDSGSEAGVTEEDYPEYFDNMRAKFRASERALEQVLDLLRRVTI